MEGLLGFGHAEAFYAEVLDFVARNSDVKMQPTRYRSQSKNHVDNFEQFRLKEKELTNELHKYYPHKSLPKRQFSNKFELEKFRVFANEIVKHSSVFKIIKEGGLFFFLSFEEVKRIFDIHQSLIEKHSKKKRSLSDILRNKSLPLNS